MMKNILFIVWILLGSMVLIASLKGYIHYGLGLADILYDGLLFVFLIASLPFYFYSNDSMKVKILIGVFTFFLFLFLKFTWLRGGVSPWNGKIFF